MLVSGLLLAFAIDGLANNPISNPPSGPEIDQI